MCCSRRVWAGLSLVSFRAHAVEIARQEEGNPPHPGELIREDVFTELGLSVSEAAQRFGVSRVALGRVVNRRAGSSPNLVGRLELAAAGSAQCPCMKWRATQPTTTRESEIFSLFRKATHELLRIVGSEPAKLVHPSKWSLLRQCSRWHRHGRVPRGCVGAADT